MRFHFNAFSVNEGFTSTSKLTRAKIHINLQKKKGATMLLIIPLVLLLVLKLANVWIFAGLSWWWIIGLAVFAFLWFEIFERILGLDKRKDDAYFEKMKQERIKRTFSKKK